LLGFALLCGACTSGGGPEPIRHPRTVQGPGGVLVPHLVGLSRREAERALETRGLFVKVQPEGGVIDDLVVGQRPEADVRVPRHSLIVLTVRCVPAPCPAPPEGTTIYDPCSCAFR
jgi:hypothetical protein